MSPKSKAAVPTMTIVIDSREQRPYSFAAWQGAPPVTRALPAGDYSVDGLEHRIAIERKSLSDAYGTFGGGRDRFERELQKLAEIDFAAVIIEASMWQALMYPPARVQKFTPKHFNRAWIAWAQRYGVHFLFCETRELAQRQTYLLLERFWRDVMDGKR
jgi:ERCC4-type nuclease